MRDEFLHRKEQILNKLDKSYIGGVDPKIQNQCDLINTSNNFYTTSSCSGRLMISKYNSSKNDHSFLFVSHDLINTNQILEFFETNNEFPCNLRQESMILHVCCRNIDLAIEFMKISKQSGCNQCGIISVKDWGVIVECICEIKFETVFLSQNHFEKQIKELKEIVDIINSNLEKNWQLISLFERNLKDYI